MPEAHFYDGLNRNTPLVIMPSPPFGDHEVSLTLAGSMHMEELVRAVLNSNKGLHRFLSELQTQIDHGDDPNPARLYLSGRIEDFFDMEGM